MPNSNGRKFETAIMRVWALTRFKLSSPVGNTTAATFQHLAGKLMPVLPMVPWVPEPPQMM